MHVRMYQKKKFIGILFNHLFSAVFFWVVDFNLLFIAGRLILDSDVSILPCKRI
jgi:hypothetical protein